MYVRLPLILSVDFSWLLQVPFPFGRLNNQETIIFRYFCIENLEAKILLFSKSNWDPVIHLEVIQWLWKAGNAIFSNEIPGQSMKLTWKDPAPWNIASFNHFEVKFDLHQETTNPKHSFHSHRFDAITVRTMYGVLDSTQAAAISSWWYPQMIINNSEICAYTLHVYWSAQLAFFSFCFISYLISNHVLMPQSPQWNDKNDTLITADKMNTTADMTYVELKLLYSISNIVVFSFSISISI